jgi:hypothetical protein
MGQGKNIPGVPETISRKDYQALMESLGLELKNLVMLEFRRDGVYATLNAPDADGRLRTDPKTGTANRHHIYIPVVDDSDST